MHPSHVIRGKTTQLLAGRRIVVGVSGSIAAVEVPRIVRELIRHGADVRAVMSPEAQRIVSPEALEFATGHPAVVHLTGNVEHVTLLGPGEGRAGCGGRTGGAAGVYRLDAIDRPILGSPTDGDAPAAQSVRCNPRRTPRSTAR